MATINSMAKIYSILFSILFILYSCNPRISQDGVIANPETSIDSIKSVIDSTGGELEVVHVVDSIKGYKEVQEPKPITGTPTSTTPSITEVYMSQIGVSEATGHNDGKDVEKYLKAVGLPKGYAWCAAFVRWCYDRAKIKTTVDAAAASAHNPKNLVFYNHKFIKEPEPGDAFTLWYSKLNRIGHTGFFHNKVNSSVFETYEGNTGAGSAIDAGGREGDGVYRKYRSFNATYSISRWKK